MPYFSYALKRPEKRLRLPAFDDHGGCRNQLEALKRTVELNLFSAQVLIDRGVSPSRSTFLNASVSLTTDLEDHSSNSI